MMPCFDGWMDGWMDDDFGYKPKIPTENTLLCTRLSSIKSQRKKSIKSQSIGKKTLFDFDFVPSFGHFLSSRHLSLSGKPPQVMVLRILFIYFNFVILLHWGSSTKEI